MGTQVTLTLSDAIYGHAESIAGMTGRSVPDILATTIELALPPFFHEYEKPLAELSDETVLALSHSQMEMDKSQRLSLLFDRQQSGVLTEDERKELLALMEYYNAGLLRKAQALKEAYKRGLRGAMIS